MIVKNVGIQNFLTIGSASLDLESKGLSLVQGENNSDPSAESNGAGKTSIAEAICWCLYGQTARGVKGDAVVNRIAKKDCSVQMTVKIGDLNYTVTRCRRHKTGKNRLTLAREGEIGSLIDLTKGNDKLTQIEVEKVIGASYEVFRSAVYLAQDGMPDLPGMTDKQLKEIIEESAGLTKIEQAHKIANEELSKCRKDRDSLDRLTERVAEQLMGIHNLVSSTLKAKASFEATRDKRRDSFAVEFASKEELRLKVIEHIESALKKKAKFDIEGKLKIGELKAKIDGVAEEQRELDGYATQRAEKLADFKTKTVNYESAKADAEKATKEFKTVTSRIGTPCSECGKEYCEEDVEAAKKIASDKAKAAITLAKTKKVELDEATRQADEAESAYTTFKASMTDVSEAVAKKSKLEQLESELSNVLTGLKRELSNLDENIERIETNRLKNEEEINPHLEDLKAARAELADKAKERDSVQAQIEENGAQLQIIQDVVAVFGRKGVRAHMLETVTPYLNERTSYYLGTLSDGSISAIWSTLTIKSDGELAEKFNIEVSKLDGADNYHGLSGGEKRKVRLATAMALQDLVASRATKPISLFVADEIDDALDDSGLERLMSLLEEKGREKGTLILISHNDIGDWVRNVTKVVKDANGTSSVVGHLSEADT